MTDPKPTELNDDAVQFISLIQSRMEEYATASQNIMEMIHDNVLLAAIDMMGIAPNQLTVTHIDMATDELIGIAATIQYDPSTTTSMFLQQFREEDNKEIEEQRDVERIVQFTVPVNIISETREDIRKFLSGLRQHVHHLGDDTDGDDDEVASATDGSHTAVRTPAQSSSTQFDLASLTEEQQLALVAGIANTSGSMN